MFPDVPPGTCGFPGEAAKSQDLGVQISGGRSGVGAQCLLWGLVVARVAPLGLSPTPEQVGRHQHQELFSVKASDLLTFLQKPARLLFMRL